jgi:hypothetical protein
VSLFGRWNWWMPGWVARLLRVEPSPLAGVHIGRHRAPRGAARDQPAVVDDAWAELDGDGLPHLEAPAEVDLDRPARHGAPRELVSAERSTGRHGMD